MGFPVFGQPFGRGGFGNPLGQVGNNHLPTFGEVMAQNAPLVWLRYNETSGLVTTNYGSLGAALNAVWSPGVGADGQTGALGVNEAYLYDALNSIVILPSNAAINAMQAATYLYLIKANSAGEASNARLLEVTVDTEVFRINSINLDMRMIVPASVTTINTITNVGFLSLATFTVLFVTYDFSGDKKGRIYKGVGGVVTEATYATQTAGAGTKGTQTGVKNLGNAGALSRTFDGLIDEIAIFNYVLTSSQMIAIAEAIARGLP